MSNPVIPSSSITVAPTAVTMIRRFLFQTAGSFEAAIADIDVTGGIAGRELLVSVDFAGVVGSLGSTGLDAVLS